MNTVCSNLKALFVASVEEHILCFHMPYIQYFLDRGYEVHIAVKKGKKYNELATYGVVVHNIHFSRSPYALDNVRAFYQIIMLMITNKYAIVHTHTPMASLLSRIAAKLTNTKPVLYTAHGFHFFSGAPILNWLIYYPIERVAARFTDALITINREDFNRAHKFKLRRGGKLFFVNGVGVNVKDYEVNDSNLKDQYRKKLGIDADSFVIICIAELNKNKNQLQLIKAIEGLKSQQPILLLVGTGGMSSNLENYINSRDLNKVVKFLGHRDDVPELLNMSNCLALLSTREGLPRSIMEGMAAGLPIIATNVRGCRDLVCHDKNGYIVEVGDVKGTRRAIKTLMEDSTKCLRFGEKSKKVVEKYSLDCVEKHMKKIYQKYTRRVLLENSPFDNRP